METAKNISDYIISVIENGNITAYNILINISYEMMLNNSNEGQIKSRIDDLLRDPLAPKTPKQ